MINLDKIKINKMMLSDLDEIKDFLIKDFDDFWNYQIFKEEITNNNSNYFILRYDNEIICISGYKKILDEADLMNIITKKDKRNLGFAKILLKEIINICRRENLKTITLEVNEKNLPAISLYKYFNFKEIGLRKKYYNNQDNAILMTLYL